VSQPKKYVLFIERALLALLNTWETFQRIPGYEHAEPLLITSNPTAARALGRPITILPCTFDSDAEIQQTLAPYTQNIVAVFSTGETNVQYLRRIIPFLPPYIHTATPEALATSTDKQAMREAFRAVWPEITPAFLEVTDASEATQLRIEQAIPYPVIVKPTGLASSLLIQSCASRAELAAALTKIFAHIHDVYRDQKRAVSPRVLVEEYLEGDFYSTDAYVMERGQVFLCPPVGYIPVKQRGVDDFSLYKRFVPTTLTAAQHDAMQSTATKAVDAVGLTHSSAHIELVLTTQGWKVIELGPRIGRYRHRMYQMAYGIHHYANDLLIHFGQAPTIPAVLQKYCAAYSLYPESEGEFVELAGLEFLQQSPYIKHLHFRANPGDIALHAKHGGKLIVEFYVVADDQKNFDKTVATVEAAVKVITRPQAQPGS
jgi:biotin carboxylase